MRRETAILLLALAAAPMMVATGCTSTDDVGGATETLVAVDVAQYSAGTRYLDLSVSDRPMTAQEMGDISNAYPVQMTFGQNWAVAWAVKDGVAQIGNSNAVLGAWRIYESRDAYHTPDLQNAQPASGETHPTAIPTVTVPGSTDPGAVGTRPTAGLGVPNLRISAAVLRGNVTPGGAANGAALRQDGIVFADWLQAASDEYRDLLQTRGIHGPCL